MPEDYGFKLIPIEDDDQMRANILYLDRNSYEVQLAVPGGYPWGSSYLHFSLLGQMLEGKRAETIKACGIEKMAGGRVKLPGHWMIHPIFGLLPSSFVNNRIVKKLFKSPKEYTTRLVKDYETFVTIAHKTDEEVLFGAREIDEIVSLLLKRDYNGKSLSWLDNNSKGRLVVSLSKDYYLPAEAISQAVGMSVHLVNQILRSKDFGK